MYPLEVVGCKIAQGRVPPLGVMKTLEVAEATGFRLLTGLIVGVNLLSFQGSEERRDNRIVRQASALR